MEVARREHAGADAGGEDCDEDAADSCQNRATEQRAHSVPQHEADTADGFDQRRLAQLAAQI